MLPLWWSENIHIPDGNLVGHIFSLESGGNNSASEENIKHKVSGKFL